MKLVIDQTFGPSKVQIVDATPKQMESLRKALTYRDRSAEFEYQKFRHATWFLNKYGEEAFRAELEIKKAAINTCLLFETEGVSWTYSGLVETIQKLVPDAQAETNVSYPEPSPIPWVKKPVHQIRTYQSESVERLLEIRHGAVEVATGLGKTRMILEICRKLGLKTVVMAPSTSIANNLFENLSQHLGVKYIGFIGDGKKKLNKLITIGIYASLAKIKPDSKEWNDLSRADVFIVDESHMTPAATLEKVCMGLCARAPYRFFFSATQIRSDGADSVLKGITGPIVYTMTFKEGVDNEFLARPHFKMVSVPSTRSFQSRDANEMTRAHLYYNPEVARRAGQIANGAVERLGHQVLILVQEIEQFAFLLPYLKHEVQFAHGGVTKENKDKLPKQYWESDPTDLVDRFNKGEFPVLVGTSCISTGTDIQTAKTVIYMMGQASEIKTKQAVGRGTRRPEGKTEFFLFDFRPILPQDRSDNARVWSAPFRHAKVREEFYRDLYPDVEVV